MQGLARSLRPHSHCKPSQAEQNRTDPTDLAWKTNRRYEMEAFTVNAERSRTDANRAESNQPCRTEPDRALHMFCMYLLRHPDSLLHFDRSASLSARQERRDMTCREREWSGVERSGVEWSGVERSVVEWSGVESGRVEWSGCTAVLRTICVCQCNA